VRKFRVQKLTHQLAETYPKRLYFSQKRDKLRHNKPELNYSSYIRFEKSIFYQKLELNVNASLD
jgi:hypothetical protein